MLIFVLMICVVGSGVSVYVYVKDYQQTDQTRTRFSGPSFSSFFTFLPFHAVIETSILEYLPKGVILSFAASVYRPYRPPPHTFACYSYSFMDSRTIELYVAE